MLRHNRVVVALACLVGATLLSPVASNAAPAGAKKVGSDSTGDWGAHSALAHTPGQEVGGPTGQDLTEAHIGMADKKTVNFIITVSGLPATGGVPEAVRYVWSFQVDGKRVELDGRFTNYSGRACDPAAGCPPPRDPGRQPFAVLGNCSGSGDDACEEVGVVEAAFSPADGTVTIPVPLKTLGARAGSKIAPYTSDLAST